MNAEARFLRQIFASAMLLMPRSYDTPPLSYGLPPFLLMPRMRLRSIIFCPMQIFLLPYFRRHFH